MTFILASLFLLPTPGSADSSSSTTGWASEPNGRGTFGLICSCVLTLTICVWTALHLNVPAARSTLRNRALEGTKWVLYGIFAPELVVATAAAQYIVARWLKREIEKDAAHRQSGAEGRGGQRLSRQTWDMTQCFYAVMGGFVVDLPPAADEEDAVKRVTVTPEGIRLLSFIGKLPDIHESQIQDKSKADWMAKSLVCVQAGWMVAQVIGRLIKKLPVSLLEINTCGHVACAVLLYLLWWSKPLDVLDPTVLEEGSEDFLSLMTLCSSMSAINGVTDIRCFMYMPEEGVKGEGSQDQRAAKILITTHLSIGSPGTREPSRFLGFDVSDLRPQVSPVAVELQKQRVPRSAYMYHIDQTKPTVAPECLQTYFTQPYTGFSLRHGTIYCRRLFADVQQHQKSHRPVNPVRLAQAAAAADAIWAQCVTRPTFAPYYFTSVPTVGVFLGETDYLVSHIVNFPSMSNLGLGQVNIHRDVLRSVLALTAAGYGGLHLSGWVDHFPTQIEQKLWLVASLVIACSGVALWTFFLARQVWPWFDIFVSGAAPGARLTGAAYQKPWMKRAKSVVLGSILFVFVAARVFLVVEAFLNLREAPSALYETPEWTDFFPHF
ncbi:hypothetical protein ColTof4_13753 [Colletotrichum tofieldiae]|uniref:Uncharacterized protein n=1 Tax=Colletotrichum tofieldiae TaxID=708197 RepID=A0A166YJH3_9PEZI|nr:hypothetical protein CT0861_08162 [Colletotrichum tofieldiae]GKT54454.1 hypothetical protein ColTof3_01793 [Colletotrichum tofieldiae]GKT81330.1 hypothetical protein ColTof4_13753 [Colletotrichum tofieldiae]